MLTLDNIQISKAIRAKKKKLADDARHLWNQLCTYARTHSQPQNQAGRAWHLFLKITGQKSPYDFLSAPETPITENTMNKITSLNTAYRKAIRKAA